jgi:hypothetical protein
MTRVLLVELLRSGEGMEDGTQWQAADITAEQFPAITIFPGSFEAANIMGTSARPRHMMSDIKIVIVENCNTRSMLLL